MILSGLRAAGRCTAVLLLVAVPALAQSPATPASSQPAPPSASPTPKWGPFIDLGGAVGTDRNIGESDLFVPLLQDSRSMLFTDIRGRFDDQSSLEGNFGLGVRHMLASGWNLGGYVYYDRLKSALGNDFGQATVGAEALSLNWDARANFYHPLGPSVANLGSTSSTTAALSGTSVEVTTTGTYSQEVAMQGFDGEIGWRVPIFAPDSTTQLRVYAGGYDFHADGVSTIAGPRGRLDLTIDQVPHLWHGARLDLGAEVQHDGPRGTQAFALLSLRIPLEIFASAPPSALTPMERRMEDPIVRDVDVVSQTRSEATPTIVETATETSGGSPITVISSASTSGANLPTAVTNAGANSTVILSGSFDTGSNTTTLQSGQTVMGAGTLTVKTPSGRTATLTTASATITNSAGTESIAMADNSTLTGMTIDDNTTGGITGVLDLSTSGTTIANNTIDVTNTGSGGTNGVWAHDTAANTTVSGNTISVSGGANANAIDVQGGQATVSGNSLSATGSAGNNYTVLLASADIQSGSSGNKAVAGSCGVGTAGTGTTVTFTNASPCGP